MPDEERRSGRSPRRGSRQLQPIGPELVRFGAGREAAIGVDPGDEAGIVRLRRAVGPGRDEEDAANVEALAGGGQPAPDVRQRQRLSFFDRQRGHLVG